MAELGAYNASADLRNQALKPLQDIKKQVQEESHIPNMHYQLNKAVDAVDTANELIEKSVEPTTTSVGTGVIPPKAKPVKYVSATSLSAKTFLESEQDVNDYLEVLKKELMSAVNSSMRVRIK